LVTGLLGHLVAGTASPCLGQQASSDTTRVGWQVELGGNAFLGATFNIEIHVTNTVALRAGGGMDLFSRKAVLPVQVVLLTGRGSSQFEASAGLTVAHEPAQYSGNWRWDGTQAFPGGFLGYRYHNRRGVMFRIGVVVLMWPNNNVPWIAIGIGKVR